MAKKEFIYQKRYNYWDVNQTQLCWDYMVKININTLVEQFEGYARCYYDNGNIMREGNHKNNSRYGFWKEYDMDGEHQITIYYLVD
jgi:antitoxin component YwqK of YwqJK toxin-antitoxin module